MEVQRNDGTGSFAGPSTFGVRRDPLALAVGDVNHDGKPDLIVACDNGSDVAVMLGR